MRVAKSKVCDVVVPGLLAPFVEGYRSRLAAAGYTPLTTVNMLRQMALLSRWLEANGLAAGDVTEWCFDQFLEERRAGGHGGACSAPGLRVLGDELRSLGLVGDAQVAAPCAGVEAVLVSFSRYLLVERGLAECTALSYVVRARRFLAGAGDLSQLTSRVVIAAVQREGERVSVGATQLFVVAVRALLRFLSIEGLAPHDLSLAVLSVTGRRGSMLPKGISAADVAGLLGSCDRGCSEGRRDYAVILILQRLGLRASEVAQLRIDDIDWRAGELVVRGKGHRQDRLPLPCDVGAAIVEYLRHGRPAAGQREVFLRAVAPLAALGRGGISFIVRSACRRVGIIPIGAHRLRHSLACDMVAAGVALPQIADVLRHRSLSSTAIYARVDIETLRSIAVSSDCSSV